MTAQGGRDISTGRGVGNVAGTVEQIEAKGGRTPTAAHDAGTTGRIALVIERLGAKLVPLGSR